MFANEIEKNGEKNLSSILQISEPFIKNINEIHYTVSNNINKTELEKNKHKIIRFLSVITLTLLSISFFKALNVSDVVSEKNTSDTYTIKALKIPNDLTFAGEKVPT